ncbi:damage-control phosphatase ARMT1-like [Rhopalosiphum padi]|uniref:damage-control phosphatase ARMT1-like n=1 Tax=Rhopalosiphum padi TaxID=40932 RepID=UPI00298D8815|nr:damage-control phosphatase ARMT1-like [Rhopalosiphum padi]XP_060841284.1 damage-control phosphatase ARMT1-like [Rhopalosiphum padi]
MACNIDQFLDQKTPDNEPLRGKYMKSFGYHSLMHRMPDVFSAMTGLLKAEQFTLANKEEINDIVNKLELLLSEILNNKPLRTIDSTCTLALIWNQLLEKKFNSDSIVTWFDTEWLFTENYLYIRIKEIFEKTKMLKDYDPFKQLKYKAFDESEITMIAIADFLNPQFSKKELDNKNLKTLFIQILKICLWGNRFDLSLNIGKSKNITEDPLEAVVSLDKYILTDHSDEIWNTLNASNDKNPKIIDIILDNSAYELFTDMCLADFFITYGFAETVVFHGKSIPWYVSDVTKPDFEHFLNRLINECASSALQQIGNRWNNYYKTGKFVIECEEFWTLPHCYSTMATEDSELYKKLACSQLLIFKGDLNYRKLIGDINWSPSTTFKSALCQFQPTAVVALRTLKCDCVCDLNCDYETKIDETDKDDNYLCSTNYWQVNGKYAVVHLSK